MTQYLKRKKQKNEKKQRIFQPRSYRKIHAIQFNKSELNYFFLSLKQMINAPIVTMDNIAPKSGMFNPNSLLSTAPMIPRTKDAIIAKIALPIQSHSFSIYSVYFHSPILISDRGLKFYQSIPLGYSALNSSLKNPSPSHFTARRNA